MLEMLIEKLKKGEIRGAAIIMCGDYDNNTRMWQAIRAANLGAETEKLLGIEMGYVQDELRKVGRQSIIGKTIAIVVDDEDGEVKLTMTDGSRFVFSVEDGGNSEECYVDYELKNEPPPKVTKTLTQIYQESFGKASPK